MTTTTTRNKPTAIVIGAGIAGLMAARVLSDHAYRVTILDRDRLPDEAIARRRAPRGRHSHVVLGAVQQVLDRWFPELTQELRVKGAVPIRATDIVWHQGGGYRASTDLGVVTLSMSRQLLETAVRERLVSQCSNVSITDGALVEGPVVQDGRVTGVVVGGATDHADLVVDCSGRNTGFLHQLAAAGFPLPHTTSIRMEMASGTRVLRRHRDDIDPGMAVIVDEPARGGRVGTLVPVERDRWIMTVAGVHGDVPATDPDGFADFVESLPSPELARALAGSEPLAPVLSHRTRTSQRRHVERLDRTPPGFLVLGDAICSFNPIHGHGLSSAVRQAEALEAAVGRHGLDSPRLARSFYRRAAKVVDTPWRMAAEADFTDPRTTGARPVGTRLTNRGLVLAVRASHTSIPVADQLLRVQHELASPASLMTPRMIARILVAARRSPGGSADVRVSRQSDRPIRRSAEQPVNLAARWPVDRHLERPAGRRTGAGTQRPAVTRSRARVGPASSAGFDPRTLAR